MKLSKTGQYFREKNPEEDNISEEREDDQRRIRYNHGLCETFNDLEVYKTINFRKLTK